MDGDVVQPDQLEELLVPVDWKLQLNGFDMKSKMFSASQHFSVSQSWDHILSPRQKYERTSGFLTFDKKALSGKNMQAVAQNP